MPPLPSTTSALRLSVSLHRLPIATGRAAGIPNREQNRCGSGESCLHSAHGRRDIRVLAPLLDVEGTLQKTRRFSRASRAECHAVWHRPLRPARSTPASAPALPSFL